ncbi:helix-turn-helix transcriptional regulator [Ammoniphilus sp. YIM 78166]|uniref:helix-turn-helix transcriptional regulator n=1 Tax=Ammoniphilus sp. YIM 78166 TaxID=1644106 RepID=UPI00106F55C0|nr:helix-turn-helix transcriptional regulator [Ammoniphilus sp. YIM 78166]
MNNETYTPEEVAKLLKISKYTVYELVKRGELNSYRIGNKVRVEKEDLEAFIQGKKGATAHPVQPLSHPRTMLLRLAGSHDFLVEHLVQYLSKSSHTLSLQVSYIGSLEGIMMLHRGFTDMAAVHLLDPASGDYNVPFIERLFIHEPIRVIRLATRNQGFIVASGNPKRILEWNDLIRKDIQFINRQKGSGTRFLLDHHLSKHQISPQDITGYEKEEWNHFATASAIGRGAADVTLGIESAAVKMGLSFIPLAQERFDLIVRLTSENTEAWEAFYTLLVSEDFRESLHSSEMDGYDFSHLGEMVYEKN